MIAASSSPSSGMSVHWYALRATSLPSRARRDLGRSTFAIAGSNGPIASRTGTTASPLPPRPAGTSCSTQHADDARCSTVARYSFRTPLYGCMNSSARAVEKVTWDRAASSTSGHASSSACTASPPRLPDTTCGFTTTTELPPANVAEGRRCARESSAEAASTSCFVDATHTALGRSKRSGRHCALASAWSRIRWTTSTFLPAKERGSSAAASEVAGASQSAERSSVPCMSQMPKPHSIVAISRHVPICGNRSDVTTAMTDSERRSESCSVTLSP
mmetsp:Transcript_8967/g.27829  ORF Transcript_8967/g.27829 Transcript_8967/m.27829 type:complete len:275 (+) Transcript_8967:135-959(+)